MQVKCNRPTGSTRLIKSLQWPVVEQWVIQDACEKEKKNTKQKNAVKLSLRDCFKNNIKSTHITRHTYLLWHIFKVVREINLVDWFWDIQQVCKEKLLHEKSHAAARHVQTFELGSTWQRKACVDLFHDLLLRSYLYHCVWSVITAHNLAPEKRGNNYVLHPPCPTSCLCNNIQLITGISPCCGCL